MHLYDDHFYCYVCRAHGDAVDLVSQYWNMEPKEAAQWLLGESALPSTPKTPKAPPDYSVFEREHVYSNGTKKVINRLKNGKKSAVWYHLDGGQWKTGRGGLPPILYKCGNHSGDVYIVEGEKDAENFAALYNGLAYVVSGADGAGAGWKETYTEQLKSAGVKNAIILSDNDEVGRKYANETAAALATFMESVILLDLREVWPEIPEHGDVSDLISEFGATLAVKMIDTLYNDTPAWTPPEPVPMEQPAAPPFRPFEKTALEMLPEFPVQALTPVLGNFSQEVTQFVEQGDNALVSVPALGVCSTATGRKFQVSAKDGWEEPLDTYLLTAALSGGRKSTVLDKYTMFPLSRFQKEWNIEHAAEVDEWQDKLETTKAEISAKRAEIAKSKGKMSIDDLEPLRARERSLEANPVRRMDLYKKDVSPEKLEEEMAKRGGEMAIISSEGGLLENLTGTRYSEKANLDTLLDAYTDGEIRTGRITRGDVSCDHACLNINVMCQPITVQELTANKTFNRQCG
ncbi:MAG: DUF3987 domain-containing protein [Oscillibacter sp.]|nr:DUF3987 domain-containing protein [Oscillibacter sp.]